MELEQLKNYVFVFGSLILFFCILYLVSLSVALSSTISLGTPSNLLNLLSDANKVPSSAITILFLDISLIAIFILVSITFILIKFMENVTYDDLILKMVRCGMFFLFVSFIHLNFIVMLLNTPVGVGLGQFTLIGILHDPSKTEFGAGILYIAEMIWGFCVVLIAILLTGIGLNEIINQNASKKS